MPRKSTECASAEVRAGATLLNDSNPEEEEAETELKASAMIAAIRDAKSANSRGTGRDVAPVGTGVKILLVDHEDSFVHTLADYFRQTGAEVKTYRARTPLATARSGSSRASPPSRARLVSPVASLTAPAVMKSALLAIACAIT